MSKGTPGPWKGGVVIRPVADAEKYYDDLLDIVRTLVELQDATKQRFDLGIIRKKESVLEMAKALLAEIDGPTELTSEPIR